MRKLVKSPCSKYQSYRHEKGDYLDQHVNVVNCSERREYDGVNMFSLQAVAVAAI